MFKQKVWNFLKQHSNTILNTALFYYFFHNYVLDISYLEGNSMTPTFDSKGTYVLVDKISFYFRKPKKNEIISLLNPFDKTVLLCKRVTGIEGEEKSLRNGKVITIPKNNIWVEGDNKVDSFDSRIFGPINNKLINGRILLELFPKFKVHI